MPFSRADYERGANYIRTYSDSYPLAPIKAGLVEMGLTPEDFDDELQLVDDDSTTEPPGHRCSQCEALLHSFLFACPFCGHPHASRYPVALWERSWLSLEESRDRLRAQAKGGAVRDEFAEAMRDPQARLDLRSKLRFRPRFGPIANSSLTQVTYRYLGGLTGRPSGSDARLAVSDGSLVLADARSGVPMISTKLEDILAAQAFADRVPLINGWVGLSLQNAMVLSQPTFDGGGLFIAHAIGGQIYQWAVGNQPGFFTRKADLTGYQIMLSALAVAAAEAMRRAIAVQDPDEYLRDLGLAAMADAPPLVSEPMP